MKTISIIFASAVIALCSCSSNKSAENANVATAEEVAVENVAEQAAVIELTAGTNELPATDLITVLDFNAVWCGPCQQFKPVFETAAQKYKGQITFVSVNVDSCPDIATKYNVSAIPQITFISPDGEVIVSEVGSRDEATFETLIQSVINK